MRFLTFFFAGCVTPPQASLHLAKWVELGNCPVPLSVRCPTACPTISFARSTSPRTSTSATTCSSPTSLARDRPARITGPVLHLLLFSSHLPVLFLFLPIFSHSRTLFLFYILVRIVFYSSSPDGSSRLYLAGLPAPSAASDTILPFFFAAIFFRLRSVNLVAFSFFYFSFIISLFHRYLAWLQLASVFNLSPGLTLDRDLFSFFINCFILIIITFILSESFIAPVVFSFLPFDLHFFFFSFLFFFSYLLSFFIF